GVRDRGVEEAVERVGEDRGGGGGVGRGNAVLVDRPAVESEPGPAVVGDAELPGFAEEEDLAGVGGGVVADEQGGGASVVEAGVGDEVPLEGAEGLAGPGGGGASGGGGGVDGVEGLGLADEGEEQVGGGEEGGGEARLVGARA